ncbi:MAG TPA: hypothetical protein VEM95_01785, partial [Thermoplasmata archaeon]|nr:hypothetical protein [Thermoplasmata archaeon]
MAARYPVAPAPMPYWPAVAIKPDTLAGVRTYSMNLILDIIFSVFALIIGLTSIFLVSSDPTSAIGALGIIGASTCGLVIVFVINFIVSLMSVLRIHHGAREYGPEHERYARAGVIFKWVGTMLSVLAAVLVVYVLIVGSSFFLFASGQVPSSVYIPLMITLFWTGGVTCKGQMYRLLVRGLQPPHTRRWSDIASISIPLLGIVGIAIVGFATARVIAAFSNPASIGPFEAARLSQTLIGGVFLPPGFALIGYAVFFVVYRQTVQRLEAGLTQLQAAMPPVPMWPAYAAPYQVPYGPVAAPPPPPMAAPPTPVPVAAEARCPQCGRGVAPDAAF